MKNLWLDIRFAMRQLRKSPGFSLTALLTLAFGIGATTAIFSIVEGVLLRPLPFPQPDRLVVLSDVLENAKLGSNGESGVTAPEIVTYERDTRSFAGLGGYQQTGYELSGAGAPAQINAARLTASIFPLLGVSPMMGRIFTQQEDTDHAQVAVISYAMWRSRFNGDQQVLGRKIELDRKTYQIIGVMPRSFEFPLVPGQLNRSELWTPMSFQRDEVSSVAAASWNYQMVGRLKPGVSAAQAEQDAEAVAQQINRAFPAFMSSLHTRAVVRPLDEETVEQARPLIRTLFFAVAVVLFIACANLAGLLLVRVMRRRREIAVRLALGSSGAGVVRQTLLEALVLSVSGGLLGLGLAAAALRVGISFLPETLPRIDAIRLDWRVVMFALGAAVFTGLLCGFVPAFAAARTGVNEALKEGGRTGSAGGAHVRLRSILVVTEIVVALVLLVASGLLLRSFQKLREVDLGFRTDHLLTASYGLPQKQYSTQASIDGFNDTLLRKLEELPGVEAVGVTSLLPAAGNHSNSAIFADGYIPPKDGALDLSWPSSVMGDYFRAAGIPLLRGREFTSSDTARSPLVCVVSRTLAEHFWPGQDPLGKRIHWGMKETSLPWMTVVGEVGDIKQTGPGEPTIFQIYQPASQNEASFGTFAPPDALNAQGGSILLRTARPPEQVIAELRATVHSIDPQLPLTQVQSMDQTVSASEAPRRFNAALISGFAVAAVLLAFLGIYSVIAFTAAMRTQEMAIRLALGSQRSGVLRLILTSGARLGLIGCAIGTLGAVFATRLLRSLLFQVSPLDPAVLVLAAISIFLLSLLASYIPAWRAASVEPMKALRME
ncbi:MAG TPA: ABC transporter permease [Terracidiphilus sp.]|nr:ABC transporter permease [Terracidiphilus sp.]